MVCVSTTPAFPQEPAARAQIDAATANALAALKTDIRSARITPTLTVAQFLAQTQSADKLDETIVRAQQIGGPRWIDDQTCQVKLEIAGSRIANALSSIAAVNSNRLPVPQNVLEQRLTDWKQRSFTGTGTSVSAERVSGIRPADVSPQWSAISDEDRKQAVLAARQDAADRLLESIRPIKLNETQSLADALQQPSVQTATRDWIASRPVTQLRFNDDLGVEVTLAAPSDQLLATILESSRAAGINGVPSDEPAVSALRQEFAQRLPPAIGRATVRRVEPGTAPSVAPISLPARAPAWVFGSLDAEATAERGPSPLRTKSAAESKATESLRSRVAGLQLTDQLTIGAAAQRDRQVADAVDRVMLRARLYKVDYRSDGGVLVRMMIDPRELWEELRFSIGR